jgi:transposase-like protein
MAEQWQEKHRKTILDQFKATGRAACPTCGTRLNVERIREDLRPQWRYACPSCKQSFSVATDGARR